MRKAEELLIKFVPQVPRPPDLLSWTMQGILDRLTQQLYFEPEPDLLVQPTSGPQPSVDVEEKKRILKAIAAKGCKEIVKKALKDILAARLVMEETPLLAPPQVAGLPGPPPNPASAADIPAPSGTYDAAYKLLTRDENKYKDGKFCEGLELLRELGVEEAGDLEFVKEAKLRKLGELLKHVNEGKLLRMLGFT